MKIVKDRENGYNRYTFIKDNKKFIICFFGNGDLYWMINTKDDYDVFTINFDDNFEVYSLLLKLYLAVKNASVYDDDPFYFGEDAFEKSVNVREKQKMSQKRLKEAYFYPELFDGEKITWISDNTDYAKEEIVQISLDGDTFIIEFARKDKKDKDRLLFSNPGGVIGIRFRNSGSMYDPFNLPFMDMYNDLDKINLNNKKENKEIVGQKSLFK